MFTTESRTSIGSAFSSCITGVDVARTGGENARPSRRQICGGDVPILAGGEGGDDGIERAVRRLG